MAKGGHTLPFLKGHGLPIFKWYGTNVLLRPLRPELVGQDPFQISGLLCQTRKTPTLKIIGVCCAAKNYWALNYMVQLLLSILWNWLKRRTKV
jgi:hypothetical protein